MKVSIKIVSLFVFLIFVGSGNRSFAAITFDNGKWGTTFACDEAIQYEATLDCNGLQWGGAWYFGEKRTQITAKANNTDGEGGNGARFWLGNGTNLTTGHILCVLPAAQKELWIRWYVRYEDGFAWDPLQYHKALYIYTAGDNNTGTQLIPQFLYSNRYQLTAQNVPHLSDQVYATYGWSSIMGKSTSDGRFHCYEIHIKMDTDTTDGIGQLWVDGILRVSNTSVNWSNSRPIALLGWKDIKIFSNAVTPNNPSGAGYVDYDDIVIYNTTPPNKDLQGNYFIGPLGMFDFKEDK